jgi:hypothetical protein
VVAELQQPHLEKHAQQKLVLLQAQLGRQRHHTHVPKTQVVVVVLQIRKNKGIIKVMSQNVARTRPWQTREEMLVDMALQSAISDPETIRQIRPTVPQQLMPQTRGFIKQELGVMDILSVDRNAPTYRSWVSGAVNMLTRAQMNDDAFTGSGRYSMNNLW